MGRAGWWGREREEAAEGRREGSAPWTRWALGPGGRREEGKAPTCPMLFLASPGSRECPEMHTVGVQWAGSRQGPLGRENQREKQTDRRFLSWPT